VAVSVTIAPPTLDDGAEFIAAVRESRPLHHPWVDTADTVERYVEYLERTTRTDHALFLVRHDTCGRLVGFININGIVFGSFRSGYLGYAAFSSHAGRGLMAAGLHRVLQTAFGPLALHRLEANIQPHNAPSIALVRRFGFQREGISPRYLKVDGQWRDHERWALTAEMWDPARSPVGDAPVT
jgi:ribosomal-protein-alanine N-acetyltransferase